MRVELRSTARPSTVDVEPRRTLLDCLREDARPQGHPRRLRARRVRRLHHPGRRRAGALLPDAGGAGRRARAHHHRGPEPRSRRAERAAGCLLRDARAAVRLLHAGHDPGRPRAAGPDARRRAPRSSRPSRATSAAAPATARSSRRSRWPPSACAGPTSKPAGREHGRRASIPLRLEQAPGARGPPLRRAAEATYVSDVTPPGTLHAAVLTSPYACARIVTIDADRSAGHAGRACRGRGRRAGGGRRSAADRRRCAAGEALSAGRRPRALRRRMGGRRGGRYPCAGRGRARENPHRLRAAAVRARRGGRLPARQHRRCIPSTAPTCCSIGASCGATWTRAFAAAPHKLAYRVKWGRSATVPIETFGVVASWDPWREMLDVWASIQMPKYRRPDRARPAHAAERRARAPGRRRRRQLRRQARHQAHRAGGLPVAPAVASP